MRSHLTKLLYACLLVVTVVIVCVILLREGEQDEKLTYSGRVVNSDGVPIAGAEVLYAIELDRFFVRLKPAESVGRTAANGKFRFEILQPEPEKWYRVDIIATHPDYALGWQNLPPQNTAEGSRSLVEWSTSEECRFRLRTSRSNTTCPIRPCYQLAAPSL